MNRDDFFIMREAMTRFGGRFVKSLSICLAYADPVNREILIDAFTQDTVVNYGPGTSFFKTIEEERAQKERQQIYQTQDKRVKLVVKEVRKKLSNTR